MKQKCTRCQDTAYYYNSFEGEYYCEDCFWHYWFEVPRYEHRIFWPVAVHFCPSKKKDILTVTEGTIYCKDCDQTVCQNCGFGIEGQAYWVELSRNNHWDDTILCKDCFEDESLYWDESPDYSYTYEKVPSGWKLLEVWGQMWLDLFEDGDFLVAKVIQDWENPNKIEVEGTLVTYKEEEKSERKATLIIETMEPIQHARDINYAGWESYQIL